VYWRTNPLEWCERTRTFHHVVAGFSPRPMMSHAPERG
jgi:hypothetical protein